MVTFIYAILQLLTKRVRVVSQDQTHRPPLKPRSQSAVEGIAARGGFGPISPISLVSPASPISPISPSGNVYPMSPTITLERHATVQFEPSIKSMDLPRSPNTLSPDSPHRRSRKVPMERRSDNTGDRGPSESWLSRLFGWKTKGAEQDDTKEYP